MADIRYGATPEEWAHLDMVLDLTADLLPVVSDPAAKISPHSSLKSLGKTPSRYNGNRLVSGIRDWTRHVTSPSHIAEWAAEPNHGICVQTRRVKALDVDISDVAQAKAIHEFLSTCGLPALPERSRSNSAKFLQVFDCPDLTNKRIIKTAHGIIELLATGQQFIACGAHTSGARYEWANGLPNTIPVLTLAQIDTLWSALEARFGIAPSSKSTSPSKAAKLADAIANDPIACRLYDAGYVLSQERDGRLNITCPFADEHTSESSETATVYWPSNTGGYTQGHFDCKHAHCESRSDQEYLDKIDYHEDLSSEFAAIGQPVEPPSPALDHPGIPAVGVPVFKFNFQSLAAFAARTPAPWVIKGVLPQAELGLLIGQPGCGKSFFALDLALAIATGAPWCGHKVRQGRVAYIAAEGAGGFANRVKAVLRHKDLDPSAVPLSILPSAPNFMDKADVVDVARSIVHGGGADVIFIDTYAQVTPGADENSGRDVGKSLALCRGLHRATRALVILLHHTGKDASKGARGWSGLTAAADVAIEVVRFDSGDRMATVVKQKDGADGGEFGFRLEPVILGIDEDDEEITSCVLEHTEAPSKERRTRNSPLKPEQKEALTALNTLVPLNDNGVQGEEWLNALVSLGRRRYNAKRTIDTLLERGEVYLEGTRYFFNAKGD